MGKFTGIILVSDFDGTFFSPVPENYKKNIDAVERFKRGGGLFAFATGRDLYSILAVEPDMEHIANAPVVLANGAKLYDISKKEYIISYTLDMNLFTEFLEVIYKRYPDIGLRFSCRDGAVVPELNEIIRKDLGDIFLENTSVREIPLKELTDSGEEVYKCVMVHEPEILDRVCEIAKNFNKENNGAFFFTRTYRRGFEAVDGKASKGAMALKLKEYLNNRDNREYKLFAIGDYDNDLDMIELADCGAAPKNALEYVKNAAQIQTVSCSDGAVADLIQIIERNI